MVAEESAGAPATSLDPRSSEPTATATPWAETERAIATAELCWITTVRADGRPHVTPLTAARTWSSRARPSGSPTRPPWSGSRRRGAGRGTGAGATRCAAAPSATRSARQDDVAATTRVLDRQDGPTILVGRSWGGTVITEAGVHPKVAGLVYVSALAPDAGETTAQQYEGFGRTPEFVIDVGEDGYGFLNREKFTAGFAHDAGDEDAAFLRDSQVPIDMSVFATPVKNAAWRDKPTWAVIATEDESFDQATLQHMAERAGATITNVSAGHALYLTRAGVVPDVIDAATGAAR